MHRFMLGLLVASIAVTQTANAVAEETRLGRRIDEFSLRDYRGKVHHLSDYEDSRLLVVAFVGTECPLVKLYAPRLEKLANEFAARGVQVLGINANVQDPPRKVGDYARRHGISFPILKDPDNSVADAFGAVRTPEVFVLDGDRVVRYHGRIDDQYGVGYQKSEVSRRDLVLAVESLLAGAEVAVPETEAVGCFIGRVRKIEPKGTITYANQISRILNRRCVECHRDGELAPFPLTSYEEVVGWAETIREVVAAGRMPPWFADPQYGHFANDASMSDEEKDLLFSWVDNGYPAGDPADLPEPPQFVTGWRMGEPDAVYHMEEAFDVPADETVDYQYFVVDPKLEDDVWVSAAEARPGNSEVVHHIVLFAVPRGATVSDDGRGSVFGQMLAIYAPGMPPWEYPHGIAMKVAAGSKFVIQMHYTPNGTPQSDRSYVGLKFADAAQVQKRVRYGLALNASFEIPPGADNHMVRSRAKFRHDTLLLHLFPHMHYRGKAFRFEARYPDGTSEVLLDVPHYDFNWQLRYDFEEPKVLPKGTELLCTAYFDNSEDNPMNPDPTRAVRFGLQSWEEMMVGYYSTVPVDEDLTAGGAEGD